MHPVALFQMVFVLLQDWSYKDIQNSNSLIFVTEVF